MKNIILFVNTTSKKVVEQIRKFEKKTKVKYRIAVIGNLKKEKEKSYKNSEDIDIVLSCDIKNQRVLQK